MTSRTSASDSSSEIITRTSTKRQLYKLTHLIRQGQAPERGTGLRRTYPRREKCSKPTFNFKQHAARNDSPWLKVTPASTRGRGKSGATHQDVCYIPITSISNAPFQNQAIYLGSAEKTNSIHPQAAATSSSPSPATPPTDTCPIQ